MTTPAVSNQFPRERDAINGHVMTEAEIADMDSCDNIRAFLRAAEFNVYRLGDPTPKVISLRKGCTVIPFRPRDLPDMTNVIAANFGRPDTTPPAAAMPRAA